MTNRDNTAAKINSNTVPAVRKLVYLSFPHSISGQPLVCNLARIHNLCFNILRAQITPRQEGFMTLEIFGAEDDFTRGIDYLKQQGIKVNSAAQYVTRDEDSCIHCGMCTAICPTHSLVLDTKTRKLIFHTDKCSACGMCTRICPVRAMSLDVDYGALE